MPALRRNLVPILVGLAAVLVSIAAVLAIAGRLGDHDRRYGERGNRGSDHRSGRSFDGRSGRGFDRRSGPQGNMPHSFQPRGGAVLGVTVQPRDGGVEVQSVLPGSPAAGAGVRPGDVITRADGHDVRDVEALRDAVAGVRVGQQYDLMVRRDGREQTLRVERASGNFGDPRMQPGQFSPGQGPGGGQQPGPFQPRQFAPGGMPPGMTPPGMMPPGMMPGAPGQPPAAPSPSSTPSS